jgi:hypothetical protein
MYPEVPPTANSASARGLPPVVPPSGKFLVQLFLVPGIIVAVALVWLLGFSWLFGSATTPDKFLQKLDSSNPDVRWRAASDLAQVLLRDDRLASDPKFALDLAGRLRQALDSGQIAEQALAERLRQRSSLEMTGERDTLEAERNYLVYLGACLGNFSLPVGVPLLCEMATQDSGAPAETLALRRRQAVWALANLGENQRRFDRLPPDRQAAVRAELETEAATADHPRSDRAQLALDALNARRSQAPRALGVDVTLAKCAGDRDPFLREIAGFALNFWEGDAQETARMENTLVKLLHDDGQGAEPGTSVRGLEIRYNAAAALARRGSDRVRLDVLGEMLDEPAQLQNFRTKLKDGREVADETAARNTVVTALKAVAELHRRRPDRDLSALYPAVDALAAHGNAVVRAEAERTRVALGRK